MKFGVIRFPGSCDEVDALLAAQRVGEAVLLWHARPRPAGRRRGDRARRLLLRRLPARRRDRPVRAGDGGGRRVRRATAGSCSGSATASRSCARPGCSPARCCPNTSLRFVFRQVELEVVDADTPFTRACEPGERLSIPVKHTTGRYYSPETLDVERGQVLLRYAPGREPERLAGRHRRRLQRARATCSA